MYRRTRMGVLAVAALTTTILVGAAACAPPPPPPRTTTTTASTTSTVPVSDLDNDGIPDALDHCPTIADPDGVCPATVYQVRTGIYGPGEPVAISNVVVTATTSAGDAYAQVQLTDPTYNGPRFSAIRLHAAPGALEEKSVVNVRGTIGSDTSLTLTDAPIVVQTGVLPAPATTPAAALDSLAYDGLLVVTDPAQIFDVQPTYWQLDTGFTVRDTLIGTLPTAAVGDPVTVVGIGGARSSGFDVLPRTPGDIT